MVTNEVCQIVNAAKENRQQVCAVGTTVLRSLETAVSTNGMIKPFDGWTNKFIFPPYDFTVATSMISNFHMPYSMLLMFVAAGDYDYVMHAYS